MVTPDEDALDGHAGFKSSLTKWLFLQGTSTVLLVLILGVNVWMAVKGLPAMWDRHEAVVRETRADFAEVNKSQREDLLEHAKNEREDFVRALDRFSNAK
jgi:hypothetical protein